MEFYRWRPNDYREKTMHLDPYQDGCYRRLIDEYMTTRKPLPDNPQALARICGISLDNWMLLANAVLMPYFKQSNGVLIEKNCEEELAFQDNRIRFRSERAKKAASTRHIKNKDLLANAEHESARVESREKRRDKGESLLNNIILTAENPSRYPEGYETFWDAFPKKRRDAKDDPKTIGAYRKALQIATAAELCAAVVRYSASDEVARGFAKGTQAWLNAKRWTYEYSAKPQLYASAV